jgi:hypothetical protein
LFDKGWSLGAGGGCGWFCGGGEDGRGLGLGSKGQLIGIFGGRIGRMLHPFAKQVLAWMANKARITTPISIFFI